MSTKTYMARIGQTGRNREDELTLCLLNIVELGNNSVTIFRDHVWIFASEMPLSIEEGSTVLFEASYDQYETRNHTQGTLTHIKVIDAAPGFIGLHPKDQPITIVCPPLRDEVHAHLLFWPERQPLTLFVRDICSYAKNKGWIYNFAVLDGRDQPQNTVSSYTPNGICLDEAPAMHAVPTVTAPDFKLNALSAAMAN